MGVCLASELNVHLAEHIIVTRWSMSFAPPVSGFNVVAHRCVITVNELSCVWSLRRRQVLPSAGCFRMKALTWGGFLCPQCRFGCGQTDLGPPRLGYLRNVWRVNIVAWEEELSHMRFFFFSPVSSSHILVPENYQITSFSSHSESSTNHSCTIKTQFVPFFLLNDQIESQN